MRASEETDMSLEAQIAELTAAVKENTIVLKELCAGREEALAQLKATAGGDKPATRSRGKKAEEPAGGADEGHGTNGSAGGAQSAEVASAPTKRTVDTSDDGMRKLVSDWIASKGNDPVMTALSEILKHFGSPTIVGPKSTLTPEQRYQVTFYMARYEAGLPVDFAEAYEFDGDPLTQGAMAEEAPGADDLLG